MSKLTKPTLKALALTTGVDMPNSKWRIEFQYKGTRCREVLSGPKYQNNPDGVRNAFALRNEVLEQIEDGTFVYSKMFPKSKRALAFDEGNGKIRLVRDAAEAFLQVQAATRAPSTVLNNRKKIEAHVLPTFGDKWMHKITPSELRTWQFALLNGTAPTSRKKLSEKTVNEIFSLLRQMFEVAFIDEVVTRNVVKLVPSLQLPEKTGEDIRPFTMDELARLDATDTKRISEKNMLLFNCWVGLRASELCALAWEDIDMDNWTARVRRGLVDNEFKGTKEKISTRIVDIPKPARKYLIAQRLISENIAPITVPVRQHNSRQQIDETIRVVFVNTKTLRRFDEPANANKHVAEFCAKADVPYRPMNQTRHTFACRALTIHADRQWIIRQLGHTDEVMLRRHYGKFIDSEHVNRSDDFERRLAAWEAAQGS